MIRFTTHITLLLACLVHFNVSCGQEAAPKISLAGAELGSTPNVHRFGSTVLCGQPSSEDFAEAKKRGIKTVVTLRRNGELNWDEKQVVDDLGLEFIRLSFSGPDSLTDDIFGRSLQVLSDKQKAPLMLHCGSANRVGAIWLVHRVINDGVPLDQAVKEAKVVGLRTPGYEEKARQYIKKNKQEAADKSVKPGINDRFLDPNLDVSEWLGRFEIESREVYAHRERVLAACAIKPGMTVADIGAGTGFYSRLFASAVGDKGRVFSVDISPAFLDHIQSKAKEDRISNMTTVLCSDRSVKLPPSSVDLAFVCDTYHHFEYPAATLASIHQALKPGGTFMVIDFERIPGESREFIIGHVRAGKEVFRKEIIDAGFEFVEEIEIPSFKENYVLRFRKEDQ